MDACATATHPLQVDAGPMAPAVAPPRPGSRLLTAAHAAGRRVAPLWPLKHFVAVNPFLGLTALDFVQAAESMARTTGARMTMPRSFYADAIASGRIADADLAAALADAGPARGIPADIAGLKAAAISGTEPTLPLLPTVADVASAAMGVDWAGLARDRISGWAAGYFDEGQAAWASAWRDLPPYAAWRAEMTVDRTPEVMGLASVRRIAKDLPLTAEEAIIESVAALGLDGPAMDAWFHRLLMTIGGWASFARYRVWQSELYGASDTALTELLAVRLGWEVVILRALAGNIAVAAAWAAARDEIAARREPDPALTVDAILQSAFERAWQREFFTALRTGGTASASPRSVVRAAFCIDVRSEVFRRAFESVAPEVETIGFAGFFGFPIEYVPLGQTRGGAQCPVLLAPRFTVCESVDADDAEEARQLGLRIARRRAGKAWKAFKTAAVSSFGFVETMGWRYAGKLATDAFGLTRTVPHPSEEGIDAATQRRLAPRIAAREVGGRATGFSDSDKLDMAEAVLKAMSMRQGFARLVLLAGHGSTTVNNPHATGLDCGACGGHTGEANARVAAAILNDPHVRTGLAQRGIGVPCDTVFLGCLHDTTTDEVTIFDEDAVPSSHAPDLARLKGWLQAAGRRARAERAALLDIAPGAGVDAEVARRSRDWSQVRPEWGLAGCAAFIAAPRERTRGCDLGGRAFLHSYDWRQDEGFKVLELIMTAPMVVASWISLQYYGATVDNRVFGSGNKVLHNVVGLLGVLEGSGGDLRVGLPLQSVHDGTRFVHEPLRLSVVIEAPTAAIDAVIARHETVRQLVENGWLHLFALSGEPPVIQRYMRSLQWQQT